MSSHANSRKPAANHATLRAISHYRGVVLGFALLGIAAGFVHYRYFATYKSKSTILLMKRDSPFQAIMASLTDDGKGATNPREFLEPYLMDLQSYAFFQGITEKILADSLTREAVSSSLEMFKDPRASKKKLTLALMDLIEIFPHKNDNMIYLVASASSPGVSLMLGRLVTSEALSRIRRNDAAEVDSASKYIEAEIRSQQDEFLALQSGVKGYKDKVELNPSTAESAEAFYLRRYEEIATELSQLKGALAETEDLLNLISQKRLDDKFLGSYINATTLVTTLEASLEGFRDQTGASAAVEFKALESQLASARGTLDQLETRYGLTPTDHPKLERLKRYLSVDEIKASSGKARSRQAYLESELKDLGSNKQKNLLTVEKMAEVVRRADMKFNIILKLQEKLFDIRLQQTSLSARFRILIDPTSETVQRTPERLRLVFLYLVFSLILGVGVASLLDVRVAFIKDKNDMVDYGIKFAGAVPELSRKQKILLEGSGNFLLFASGDSQGPQALAFRKIRQQLSHESKRMKGNVMTFVSSIAGEGKTTVTHNLCHSLSLLDKKILVIDADLVARRLSLLNGMQSKFGLSDYLQDQVDATDIITPRGDGFNYDVIPAGTVTEKVSELFYSHERLAKLIALSRERYDYILIDSAPLIPFQESLSLVAQSDTSVIIARSGFTKSAELEKSLELLSQVKQVQLVSVLIGANEMHQSSYYRYLPSVREGAKRKNVGAA